VHHSRSVRRVEVTTDGRNLVSHAAPLCCPSWQIEAASRGRCLRRCRCGISWHTTTRCRVTHLAVAIADGADA